jgi:hypothetical protein
MVQHVRKTILAGVVSAFALLPAAAADARTFDNTYPRAARLCERVADGQGPRALRGKESLVDLRCADLRAAYDAAEATLATRLAALDTQADAARATVDQTCATGTRAACRQARMQQSIALVTIAWQRVQARMLERAALNAANQAFWAAIDAIRNGPIPPPDEDPGPVIIS